MEAEGQEETEEAGEQTYGGSVRGREREREGVFKKRETERVKVRRDNNQENRARENEGKTGTKKRLWEV